MPFGCSLENFSLCLARGRVPSFFFSIGLGCNLFARVFMVMTISKFLFLFTDTIYYNWAIAIGDRARLLEPKRPEEAELLWREACEKYEKAVDVGMKRTFLGRVKDEGEELVEIVTPMSISRALNNHGLALRQRAMLMTEKEFGGGRSREGSDRSGTTTTASTAMAMAAVVVNGKTEAETESSGRDGHHFRSSGNCSVAESKSKCLSEAILKFRRAIRISPDFHRAAYNLGTVEFARGRSDYAAVYVFSALAMVTSSLPSSSETKNAKEVYSESAQLVESALPDTQCGYDSLFAGNIWFAGGIGKQHGEDENKRTAITDFDWARRRFAICASAFKTVDAAQTFRIKSESGDYVPSRNDAWGVAAESTSKNHFNVNLPILSIESCQPVSDISRPPNCFAFILSVREKEEKDNDSSFAVARAAHHYRFACETESERDVWVDAITLLASLAKRGKKDALASVFERVKNKRKKRVGFAE